MSREYNSKIEQHSNIAMNNTGKLIYKKCSDGENNVGFSRNSQNNNIMNGDVVESNVNNIIQDCSSGNSVGVMNNNANNESDVLSFTSYAKADAVGVTFCNTSGNVGFHNTFDKESSKPYVNDKYISEISKSNILRHENNHYLSHRQHHPDHYLHQRSSGPRYSEQFINGRKKERVVDDDEIIHKLYQKIEDDKNEDRGIEGDGNELNINDCSTLPSYSSFKNAIFPQLQPRMPQVNNWSEVPHPSHVITHGTTDDFDDATTSTDEFQSDSKRRTMSTFTPSNTPSTATFYDTEWENSFQSSLRDRDKYVIDYSMKPRRPYLYTGSIDRREVLRRHKTTNYSQISDPKLTNPSRHNISDLYPENREVFRRSVGRRCDAMSNRNCEATLSRSYLAARSKDDQSSHMKHVSYSMSPGLELSRNSVFRNKRAKEDLWLV